MKSIQSIIIILFLGSILFSCAPSQLTSRQTDKIDILERRIVALEKQKHQSLSDLRSETSRLLKKVKNEIDNFRKSQRFFITELDALKKDASLITNESEKARNDIRKNRIRIQKLVKRLGDQILALEELKTFFTNSINTSGSVTPEEKAAFEKVYRQYRKKNFKVALTGFELFRKTYPDSRLAKDALFFNAYIYFLTARYDSASLGFFELIEQYPNSKRANDAKWWLAISLERTGDLNGALDLYRELSKLDEQNPLGIKARFRLEELEP